MNVLNNMNFKLQKLMEQLLELRRQLISGHMTCHQKDELKLKMVDKINLGTRLLDLDIVAREPDGLAVDTKRSSAVHIFNRVNPLWFIHYFCILHTVWTINVVPAEIVRRPPGDPQGGVSGFFC